MSLIDSASHVTPKLLARTENGVAIRIEEIAFDDFDRRHIRERLRQGLSHVRITIPEDQTQVSDGGWIAKGFQGLHVPSSNPGQNLFLP